MAVKELTVKEKLVELYKLQQIDSKLDEIKIMKGELPMEVSDLEDDLLGLEKRKSRFEKIVGDIESDISNHTSNIHESGLLIDRYTKQLDNVKNNREFDALNKELELQKLEIQLSEKKSREASSTLTTKKEALSLIEDKIEKRKEDLEAKKTELSTIIEKTDKEEAKLIRDSDRARKHIEDRLLRSYDKIRKNYRNGIAVATISRESCGGCFNKTPPQVQIDIGVMQKIIACEHCGRVLVDENFVSTVKTKKK